MRERARGKNGGGPRSLKDGEKKTGEKNRAHEILHGGKRRSGEQTCLDCERGKEFRGKEMLDMTEAVSHCSEGIRIDRIDLL